ncbi:hypothetical protein BURPSS13_C0098 [Burkholderia pseudomallei S13]|nr:hypothetical protein BURPSS13_C0098 [Burkholderia pseudomallei S13]
MGTYAAPACTMPSTATSWFAPFGIRTATLSPGATPARSSAARTAAARCATSR